MNLSTLFYLVGIAACIGGVILFTTAEETWASENYMLLDDVISVPSGENHSYAHPFLWTFVLGEMQDIRISGTAEETANFEFNFYVFTELNYDLWKLGRSYEAYFEAKGDDNYSFSFSPTYEDINDLYFVVENENCVVKIEGIAKWKRKEFLGGLMNRLGGGSLFCLGIVLIILGFVAKPKIKEEGVPEPVETLSPNTTSTEHEVDVVEILKRSFVSLLRKPGFILLYLPPFIIICIATVHIWTIFGTLNLGGMIIGRFQTFSEFVDFVKSLLIWAFIYGVAYLVMMLTAQCAIILKAGVMERGKTMGVGDALAKGVRCVPRLFVALLLVFAVVIGPLLLAFGLLFLGITTFSPLLAPLGALILIVWILPMIYVGIRLSLVAPACVLDDFGPVECVKECWRVTKGNFWLIFVTGILLWIPSMLLNLIPHVGFLIAMLIVGPASVIAFTLLYLGIKKTKLPSEAASA